MENKSKKKKAPIMILNISAHKYVKINIETKTDQKKHWSINFHGSSIFIEKSKQNKLDKLK